jgi:hypothetical protein
MSGIGARGVGSGWPVVLALALGAVLSPAAKAEGLAIRVPYPEGLAEGALDGRLLLLVSTAPEGEPRFQVSGNFRSAQVFGVDVEGWSPGESRSVDGSADGFPLPSLAALPAGEYRVQLLFHRYERVTPAHGRTILVPWDRGEGQQWNRAPGNLVSTPRTLRLDPAGGELELRFDGVLAPVEPPRTSKHVRHFKMRSELLSEFWGRGCSSAPTSCCPRASTSTPRRATR